MKFPNSITAFKEFTRRFIVITAALSIIVTPVAGFANPQGAVIAAGAATISSGGNSLGITQTTSKVVIDWNSFDIAPQETVRFIQPSNDAVVLNRIHDVKASQIDGALQANGNVWLLNSNGVMFGQQSRVDVGGLVASTSDIGNNDFLSGNYDFVAGSNANASVENHGTITIRNGGAVALVAPNVKNSGTINAVGGKVTLAAGDTFAIDPYGDGLIQLAVPEHMARGMVENSGTINASGGSVQMSASLDDVTDGLINLVGNINADNGKVILSGKIIDQTGSISAKSGSIALVGKNIAEQGVLSANEGGKIQIDFTGAYIDSSRTKISTSGAKAGIIELLGKAGSTLFTSGTYDASSLTGLGGLILATASDVKLYAATLDASGKTGGGKINVGGEFQGGGTLMHSDTTAVNPYTTIKASATGNGKGGDIVVWSDKETRFGGTAFAKGALLGDGGSIEVSSKDTLTLSGTTDVSAMFGKAGSVLLDPKNIIISTTGQSYPTYELVDPSPSAGNLFGGTVVALSSGNIVVTSTGDDFAAANAGAVYLFDGTTGALISTLRGSTAADAIGTGITALTGNGNYVIRSTNWDNGAVADAGAVTWGSGTTGVSGSVSAVNSLVGTTASDQVGVFGITVLTNGNYVVRSPLWDNGATAGAGAATWGNGLGGTVGAVTAANSLVGTNTNDGVSVGGVTPLSNGNYVVGSSNWQNGATALAGAVTWGNGLGGTVGAVSAANSLVGSTLLDQIGQNIIALSNGNYVTATTTWDNGATANVGAATWGNGLGGTVGVISAANSLIGTNASDRIGFRPVALTNGNYVVLSPNWINGGAADAGAATWGNGLGGTVGPVTAANSLVGTVASDFSGSVTAAALTNGNYVIGATDWDNGGVVNAGFMAWGNGLGGTVGAVTAANALVGTTMTDRVGNSITILNNGNYVVSSPSWDNGAVADVGAATWGNGLGGTVGAVSAANSLVGATAGDSVATNGVTALTNGNYVVRSSNWINGGVGNAGAVTWGNGLGGTVGAVTAANSLVGSSANDTVGQQSTIALTNGNYVVGTSGWRNGAIVSAGAVTWGNGLGGTVGPVSAANSLVGTTAGDQVGSNAANIVTLNNGNYLVRSQFWDNGAVVNAGAVTWGNGLGGTVGAITPFNSIVGVAGVAPAVPVQNTANSTFLTSVADTGLYVASTSGPSTPTFSGFASQASMTLSPAYLTNTLNTGANLTLQASNDITINNAITVAAGGAGGALTLQAGRSVLINANITTDNGNLNLFANSTAADGVVNAQRDVGAAAITMAGATTINAGTGTVQMQIKDGAGNTNVNRGDITLNTITAGSLLVDNTGTGNIILNGAITTSAAGNGLVLSTRGNFNNVFGAGALTTGAGRFLLYGTDPATSTLNGIASNFTQYSATYVANPPGTITVLGNGLLWAVANPLLGGGGGSTGGPTGPITIPPTVLPVTPTPDPTQPGTPGGPSTGGPSTGDPSQPNDPSTPQQAEGGMNDVLISDYDEDYSTVVRKKTNFAKPPICFYAGKDSKGDCKVRLSVGGIPSN